MQIRWLKVLLVMALPPLSGISGCPKTEVSSPASSPAATQTLRPAFNSPSSRSPIPPSATRSPTRTVTIYIEGEPTPMRVSRYETIDFVTDLPEDFAARPSVSGEGRSVRFLFSPTGKPDAKAYVHLFFPQGNAADPSRNAKTIAADTTGNRGLLASNRWKPTNRDNSPPYAWAKTAIGYRDPTNADQSMGTVFVGEHRGKGFVVFTHFPAEYADGFLPRANVILENLNLR